jgi:NADH:ubiquinone oxidoreductase subunit C
MPDDATPREEIHKDDPTGAAHSAPTEGAAAGGVSPPAATEAMVMERFPGTVFHESHGQPVVYVDRAVWHDLAAFLRDEQEFTQCLDVTVVDHLTDEVRLSVAGVSPERFEVVANFLSHPRNRRIRAICEVPADDPTVASITDLYAGANFGEREAYDMFGVSFEGHPDLTRILMPDDWVGHPLRKDDAPGRVPVAFKGDPSPR